MARFSEEERPAFPDQDFFTTTVEKDIIAPKSNSGRSPGPEMLIFPEVLPIGNVSSRDSWARRRDTDQAHRGEKVSPGFNSALEVVMIPLKGRSPYPSGLKRTAMFHDLY